MTLDKSLSLAAAALIALTLAIGGWALQRDERALLSDAQTREIEVTALVLATAMDQAATLSATQAETVARDPQVASLMRAGDRASLVVKSRPTLELLGNLAGVEVLHFHTADMKSFLRVWDPDNFGQDLSRFRPMIVAVNHDHRLRKGLELGVRGLSLRAVSAITEGEQLVGTVEVGVDLKSLTELAKAATGADFALFLDASAGVSEDGTASAETGLKMEAATDTGLFQRLRDGGQVRLSRDSYLEKVEINGQTLGVMGRPLLDFSGRMIGTIVVTRDLTELEGHLSRSLVTIAAVCVVGFLVVFSTVMAVLRGLLLRPLQRLTAQLRDGKAGDASEDLSSLPEFRELQQAVRDAAGERQPASAVSLRAENRR